MSADVVTTVIANIRSTPLMSEQEEKAAVRALFAWAVRLDADFVFGCEIDHPRLRKIWRNEARSRGYLTAGARVGSENTISMKASRWVFAKATIAFLSRGVSHITPRRTVTEVDTQRKGTNWPLIQAMSTHLVSQWQEYAKAKAGKSWALRNLLARRSIHRLGGRITLGLAQGRVCILGGDVNALTDVKFNANQVQLISVQAKARNNLGKMMQLVAVAPEGTHVELVQTWTQTPVATDHAYRAARMRIVK